MTAEFSSSDQEKTVSPHAQEIEYALILSRMISAANDDPSQMRQTIYEFARARMKIDAAWVDHKERKRLAAALETAILGVEAFSARREKKQLLSHQAAQIAHVPVPSAPSSNQVARVQPLTPAPHDILPPQEAYPYTDIRPLVDVSTRSFGWSFARFCMGMLLFGLVVSAAYYKHRLPDVREAINSRIPVFAKTARPTTTPSDSTQQASLASEPKSDTNSSSSVSFPLPSDYGVYALANDKLFELNPLPTRVPDKRIAMSAPVSESGRTVLPDGKARFVIFRRDLVGSAPDRIDIRVVAKVARALTFDGRGRPSFSPVSDAWNIRNISYEFRVRPIPGNPEMLLVQAEKPDFVLPAGRFILVLKDQGYDFTVAGQVTDLAQCLERTDAANGSFYSECLKF